MEKQTAKKSLSFILKNRFFGMLPNKGVTNGNVDLCRKTPFFCKEHNLEIGNVEHEGQSRGAMIRHLIGKKPEGHGIDQDEAYRQIDNYRIRKKYCRIH